MSADTYSKEEVIGFLNQNDVVVPLLIPFDTEPQASSYGLRWTPYLLLLEPDGRVCQRAYGFQSPSELIPWVMLGAAKGMFSAADWEKARGVFERVYEKHPQSSSAPEAIYLAAVCRYRLSGERSHLKAGHQRISELYPASVWAERTLPYSKF